MHSGSNFQKARQSSQRFKHILKKLFMKEVTSRPLKDEILCSLQISEFEILETVSAQKPIDSVLITAFV